MVLTRVDRFSEYCSRKRAITEGIEAARLRVFFFLHTLLAKVNATHLVLRLQSSQRLFRYIIAMSHVCVELHNSYQRMVLMRY